MGFAAGFQVGAQAVERGLKMRDENEQRERIKAAMGLTAQEVEQRQATPEEIDRARAEAQAMAAQDAEVFGLTPQEQVKYAPQMPVEGQRIGLSRYQVGQQIFDRMPTQNELEAVRYGAAANVLAERDPVAAQRMRRELQIAKQQDELYPLQKQQLEGALAGQAQQSALTGLQLTDLQRKQRLQTEFDTGFADINKQTFKKPEERTEAIIRLVESTQGVAAAQELRSKYSGNELNDISLQAKKFDEGFRQSRAKGVIPALEWFDEQNTSFKLERDPKNPFRVIQVNTDGSRTLFADAKNENELGMIIDAKAKPGGFLELAKYDLDVKSKNALNAYYEAKTREAGAASSAAANQLSGVQVGYSRDEKGNPIQVMSGLRFNKRTGELESVQVKLDQNVVPAAALDPKKINDAAEQLVGTPVDPTNKKGPQHTFQTARQAVTDQIFNQYLGTGVPAGGLDLSPTALAKQILGSQPLSTATPPSAPATPRAPTNLGIDPNRPQSSINPVTGQPRETPGSGPNLVAAVTEGLDAGQARYVRYLESKIANNQPLTADEQIRAKRFGLQ